MKSIAQALGLIARLALWLAGAGLVLMTAIISAQVFFRYVLNDSLIWSEPLAVILMGWFIFFGAAVGIREGYHLSFDVLLYVIPVKAKLVLYTVSDSLVALFGAGMFWYGLQLALSAWNVKLPSIGISGAYDFAPLIGGGILIFLFSLERIARRAAGLPTARFGETDMQEA
ncbi:Neu5Ac permease [Pannonibacter phragmitetus]|uniref:TRAP transporter small permease protein n=1 Tax=Pannonibacter phragmitetus TaxID=121719 RepID=A0A378ZS94_9HYPH|nr:TRAP transporter small permease [Pannonibacter phragmitetus]SUA99441.1 Neu5Ac permease [Pannonibacter phragmitetus]